ncbi:hypothetical protein BC827DRAFT_1264011 [Russula dissimulans]|nr:hypothetical protein BC827DRAFT_1264011 [Russula dissimulans]
MLHRFYVNSYGDSRIILPLPDRVYDPESVQYILNEVDHNLTDVMPVAPKVFLMLEIISLITLEPDACTRRRHSRDDHLDALEEIPRTLVQNASGNAIPTLTALRFCFKIRGVSTETDQIVDMNKYKLYESASVTVKIQNLQLKTAIEAACVLLRVDDVVRATLKEWRQGQGTPPEELVPK